MKKIKSSFFESLAIKVSSYFDWGKNRNKKSDIQNEISDDFDKYLLVEDVLFCIEMLETGYQPNEMQNKLLSEVAILKTFTEEINCEQLLKYPNTLIKNNELHFAFLFDYARKNATLEKKWEVIADKKTIGKIVESFMTFMATLRREYKNGLDALYKFKNYKEEDIKKIYVNFNTYKSLFKQLYDSKLMDSESFNSFSKHVGLAIQDIRMMTSKDNTLNNSFQNIRLNYLEESRLEMRDYVIKNSNQNDKQEILKKIKKISSEKLNETIKSITLHRNYSINELEEDNKQQIKKIELLTEKINNQEVNEWVDTRLPVILEKYLSIDNDYRIKLKNIEGYNAQELMSQSLNNIINILDAKLENKNADLIIDLSIENRKLKVKQ